MPEAAPLIIAPRSDILALYASLENMNQVVRDMKKGCVRARAEHTFYV